MEKFTLIWVDSWQAGSHRHSLTKFLRVLKPSTEPFLDCADRYGIDLNACVFIFHGWSMIEGEKESDIIESKPVSETIGEY